MQRACPLVPPLVQFSDYFEYVNSCQLAHERYADLIRDAIARRSSSCTSAWPAFTQREMMMLGLAEFDDLEDAGMQVMLQLTRRTGLRFCRMANNAVICAVTTASRSYVNTLGGLRQIMQSANITLRVNMEDMTDCMLDAVMLTLGHCDNHVGLLGYNLFHANFIPWASGGPAQSFCALARVPDYMLAFAMTSHENLHGNAVSLPDDVLRLIFACLQRPQRPGRCPQGAVAAGTWAGQWAGQ